MSTDNYSLITNNVHVPTENLDFDEESSLVEEDHNANVRILEGVDFTQFVDVEYITPEEAKRLAAESRERERPIDYRYIEQMKKEGVTEELAIMAFIGRFEGNRAQTEFFLNSDFYYGSDAPTPLDRLRKAILEDTIPECLELLEGTKEGLERGDHF